VSSLEPRNTYVTYALELCPHDSLYHLHIENDRKLDVYPCFFCPFSMFLIMASVLMQAFAAILFTLTQNGIDSPLLQPREYVRTKDFARFCERRIVCLNVSFYVRSLAGLRLATKIHVREMVGKRTLGTCRGPLAWIRYSPLGWPITRQVSRIRKADAMTITNKPNKIRYDQIESLRRNPLAFPFFLVSIIN
jgi:hypothetical protein